jgi:hypothetical protein
LIDIAADAITARDDLTAISEASDDIPAIKAGDYNEISPAVNSTTTIESTAILTAQASYGNEGNESPGPAADDITAISAVTGDDGYESPGPAADDITVMVELPAIIVATDEISEDNNCNVDNESSGPGTDDITATVESSAISAVIGDDGNESPGTAADDITEKV